LLHKEKMKNKESEFMAEFNELMDKNASGEDLIKAFKQYAGFGRRIKSDDVIHLLNSINCNYEQLGEIVNSCTKALIKIRQSKAPFYEVKLPRMQHYRSIKNKAWELFNIEINKE